MQEPGLAFLLTAARLDPCRGLMALCGAFGVLVECGESPTCQAHIQEQCSRVLDTMVQGADELVMVLLTAYRSRCIPDIELSLVKIQQWLPKSNTAAEIAVGKYAPLSIDAVQQTSTMSQLDKRSLSAVCSVTGLQRPTTSGASGITSSAPRHPDQASEQPGAQRRGSELKTPSPASRGVAGVEVG